MTLLSPFSHTSGSYGAAIKELLGRGREQALHLYSEFFRTGHPLGSHPSFHNAPKLLAEILAATDFTPPLLPQHSLTGTAHKLLFTTKEGLTIESVLIPMRHQTTLCLSSQVGCRFGCAFCETGRKGLQRSLTQGEIVAQLFSSRFHLGCPVRNIVFMGMGEPLDNYEAVLEAIAIISDPLGLAIPPRRITLSTNGLLPAIERLSQETKVPIHLAVSINSGSNDLRNQLMPINRRYNLHELRSTLIHYCHSTRRSVLLAYVLIGEVNDHLEEAHAFALHWKGLPIKVNLIPYNPQNDDPYKAPTHEALYLFRQTLHSHGLQVLIRHSKGSELMAGCGQLAGGPAPCTPAKGCTPLGTPSPS